MESVEVGRGVFEAVRKGVEQGLFGARGDAVCPLTFAAAHAEVARRDEERKAREEARREARSKGRTPKQPPPPQAAGRGLSKGGKIGGNREDLSPWWLVMEDYFRAVSKEDVLAVLPSPESLQPARDPAFRVPRVGRDVDTLDEVQFWEAVGAKKAASGETAGGRRVSGGIDEDPRGTTQRRSHRLASKHGVREGSLPCPFDSAYCEEVDTEQMSPWLCLPYNDADDQPRPGHLLGLCGDDDLTVLASHIEMSVGVESVKIEAVKAEDVSNGEFETQGGWAEERRRELLMRLEKAVEGSPPDTRPCLDEIASLAREDTMDVDPPEAPKEENGACTAQDPQEDVPVPPVDSGCVVVKCNASPRPQQSDYHDPCDPVHPFTRMLLQHALPDHVFECPTAFNPNAPEVIRFLESARNKPIGSPSTPMHDAHASSVPESDVNDMPVAMPMEVEPGNNGFQFPNPPVQDCTPVLHGKSRQEFGDGFDGNGNENGLLPYIGGITGDGMCESRGATTARRKRTDVDYSALAGRKLVSSAIHTAGKRKPQKSVLSSQMEFSNNPTLLAVQSAVAAGCPDGDLDDQWRQLELARDQGLLEYSPDDEIMAEIIACQAELIQQSAANRVHLKSAMEGVLEGIPAMQEETEHREQMEQEIAEHIKAIMDHHREKQKEKRDASKKRNSERAGNASMTPTLTPRRSRPPRSFYNEPFTPAPTAVPVPKRDRTVPQTSGPAELVDPLARREQGDEALCAVCGEGHSEDPNVIVFCERCDLAVHQDCYGVGEVPAGEWLCAPCVVAEEKLRSDGVAQEQIVAGRRSGDDGGGGSRSVDCALCPVKWGAFKMSTDKSKWVHVACCHAHRETSLLPGNMPEAVEGVQDIPNSRWAVTCDLCHRKEGAVLRCSHGNCGKNLHFLCARIEGLSVMKASQKLGQTAQFSCSVQCRNHHAQRREAMSPARAAELAARLKDKGNRGITDHDVEGSNQLVPRIGQHGLEGFPRDVVPVLPNKDAAVPHPVEARAGPPVLLSSSERQKVFESLASKKQDLATLSDLRLDLESVRMLSAECKRRERLKTTIVNTRIERKNAILGDAPKYLPFMDTLFPAQQCKPAAPVGPKAGQPSTTAGPATEHPISAKRGRPVGPRSTRAVSKRTELNSNGSMVTKKTGRRNLRGNQGRAKKGSEVKQVVESAAVVQGEMDCTQQVMQLPVRGRSTRAMTRRRSAMAQSSVQGSQHLESEVGPSQNDLGRSNNTQGEVVGEGHGRLSVKRSRGKIGHSDEPRQGLAPKRALTGEEAREINSELRPRGFAFVRNDEMEVDVEGDHGHGQPGRVGAL